MNITDLADALVPDPAWGAPRPSVDLAETFPDDPDPTVNLSVTADDGTIYSSAVRLAADGPQVAEPVDFDGIGADDPALTEFMHRWAGKIARHAR